MADIEEIATKTAGVLLALGLDSRRIPDAVCQAMETFQQNYDFSRLYSFDGFAALYQILVKHHKELANGVAWSVAVNANELSRRIAAAYFYGFYDNRSLSNLLGVDLAVIIKTKREMKNLLEQLRKREKEKKWRKSERQNIQDRNLSGQIRWPSRKGPYQAYIKYIDVGEDSMGLSIEKKACAHGYPTTLYAPVYLESDDCCIRALMACIAMDTKLFTAERPAFVRRIDSTKSTIILGLSIIK